MAPRLILAAVALLLALPGCPKPDSAGEVDAAQYSPSAPLPAASPLAEYGDLRLGMSNLELAQAYNAPDGRGMGFTRVIQEFGDARNHIIVFDEDQGQPKRRIIVRLYRDELIKLVERRDGLTPELAQQWLDELVATYGTPLGEPIAGAQWVWGESDGVQLVYTRDNAETGGVSANVMLVHHPSDDASARYLEAWEKAQAEQPKAS